MRIFEVGEVMRHARGLLENDPLLADVWIHGEISSLTQSSAGHVYFGLRDGASQLKCVLFRNAARHLTARLEMGQAVVAHGGVSLYEPQSMFQLIADLVQPEGVGLWHLQFELLRRRLEDEGLFALERKRPLPGFPRRIGVVTSPTGAVIHDIVRVLGRRYPLAEVVLAPCAVQGDAAPREIVAAIQRLNEYAASRLLADDRHQAIDVIVVARGGGAPEELAVFNDEAVARAIFASAVPVVSAVGHETDYTIADFVADVRAATPSVAAELVSPDLATLQDLVAEHRRRLAGLAMATLQEHRQQASSLHQQLVWRSPQAAIARQRQQVDHLAERARHTFGRDLTALASRLEARRLQLLALSPLTTLSRGYALCYEPETGALVTAADAVALGSTVEVRLHRGTLRTEVRETAAATEARGGFSVPPRLTGSGEHRNGA